MKKIITGITSILLLSAAANAGDYYSVGVDYFKKGNYTKAAYNLEQSVRVNPKNVNARYYLAQSYLTQKRIYDATDQYHRIIILAPSSEAARLSLKGLSLIGESLSQDNVPKISLNDELSRYKDNYIDYVLSSGKLTKWKSFPIKVYIEPKKQKSIAIRALDEWKTKTANLVRFEYTNTPQNAQITIDFKKNLESTSTKDSYIAGYSKPYYQNDNIVKSDIHILAADPLTGEELPADDVFYTIIHELGHSLGMHGHSPNQNDIMYSQTSGAKGISQRDLNTMILIYKLDQKSLESKAKPNTDLQLQQALDYVKKTPEKSVGWANLGGLYNDKKMYPDAIKNYKKAISLEPEKADLHNLLGSTYLESGDRQNAFVSYKKSCDLDRSNSFYLYKFCTLCAQTGQKAVGKEYLNSYLKANPQAIFDEKIKQLNQIYK